MDAPKPLSARSVMLSLLLGSHPDRLSAAQLVAAGQHLGLSPATARVALTRAVSAGELRREDGDYVLSERLAARQRRQDEGVLDQERAWDGRWEMAVVVVTGRSGRERAGLRTRLHAARLAELREGVWLRPANLSRPRSYAELTELQSFEVQSMDAAQSLVADLWDLPAWATAGEELLAAFAAYEDPALRLAVAAAIVRHLSEDPLLPRPLLPAEWPGEQLRATYTAYQGELAALMTG